MSTLATNLLALDVGEVRIGVALMLMTNKLPKPLLTLPHDQNIWEALAKIVQEYDIGKLIIGLPRNLQGDDTPQTQLCRDFAVEAKQRLNLDVELQDEALTSKEAESLLKQSNKPFQKGDIDSLAASLILRDFISQQKVVS